LGSIIHRKEIMQNTMELERKEKEESFIIFVVFLRIK
jgi:hypothetical protein